MVVDSINQATWQVITDQAAHSDTRPHRSPRNCMMAEDACNAARHFPRTYL